MTQEEKQLLLKDLSSRLPYGVIIKTILDNGKLIGFDTEREELHLRQLNDKKYRYYTVLNDNPKPYLRSLSSMTEEEQKEFIEFHCVTLCPIIIDTCLTVENESNMFDWLNAHHFDYHKLIDKGLAIEAPKGMYKN